jgi:hypothetical protein
MADIGIYNISIRSLQFPGVKAKRRGLDSQLNLSLRKIGHDPAFPVGTGPAGCLFGQRELERNSFSGRVNKPRGGSGTRELTPHKEIEGEIMNDIGYPLRY